MREICWQTLCFLSQFRKFHHDPTKPVSEEWDDKRYSTLTFFIHSLKKKKNPHSCFKFSVLPWVINLLLSQWLREKKRSFRGGEKQTEFLLFMRIQSDWVTKSNIFSGQKAQFTLCIKSWQSFLFNIKIMLLWFHVDVSWCNLSFKVEMSRWLKPDRGSKPTCAAPNCRRR